MCCKSDPGQAIIHLAVYFISCLMAFVINKQVVMSLSLQAVGHRNPFFGTSNGTMPLPCIYYLFCHHFCAMPGSQQGARTRAVGPADGDVHDRVAPNPTVHHAPPRPDPWCWTGDAFIHTLLPACSHHHGNSSDIKLRYPND